MPTLVLRDSEAKDVGFLLAAGDEPFSVGGIARDVILMSLPLPSSSPLAEFIRNHKHVETRRAYLWSVQAAPFPLRFRLVRSFRHSSKHQVSVVGRQGPLGVGSANC